MKAEDRTCSRDSQAQFSEEIQGVFMGICNPSRMLWRKFYLWDFLKGTQTYFEDDKKIWSFWEFSVKPLFWNPPSFLNSKQKAHLNDINRLQNISTDSERKDFAKYIKGQTSMRDISLYCTLDSSEEISEEGIQDLRRGLKSLISLKRVNMQFSE